MKPILLFILALAVVACGPPAANVKPTATATQTPIPTPVIPKDGNYNATGVVTKIDLKLASVEVNHEEIKDLMPAMQMEFFVSDKKLLDGLKVGDKINFVVRYKHPTETIVEIKKQ